MWGLEMTVQRRAELEQLFEQGYRALGVMERYLGGASISSGRTPRSLTSPSTRTRASVRRAATIWRTSRQCVPGWSGSLPCQATCHRPARSVQGPLLIERTDEASGRKVAKRNSYMVQADWLARALGTTLEEMFAEVERPSNSSGT
jgi:hypothetical protein